VIACASCKNPVPDGARFCPACATPVAFTEQPTDFEDADTLAPAVGATPRAAAVRPPSRPRSHPSGRPPSSGVDHGRFEPGTIFSDRYRIVARLGQGGMGEVYRADDLRLGQPVAMKFLPPALEHDAVRLAQFHNEVRLARQIAHKNVCRVYDIGEADGLPFLTMEYVDGEDLSTLLRRIGRLPQDKALDIARQICAGISAAHERGVLHRDLKPANVMIDGQGQVRITDFGLAVIAGEVDQVRVGTPAYMAPEQLSGKGVSVQSDLYALGLVLYELFTGRRAYTATNVAELVRQHQDSRITQPTELVRDLDPMIERAIMRCLDPDPDKRPRSALSVAASLPGGDPLAAALAAGETPSPEMVAAAGARRATSALVASAATAAVLVLLVVGVVLQARLEVSNRVPFDKPPEVLVDRAQQALAAMKFAGPAVGTHWGFFDEDEYLRHLRDNETFARAHDPFTGMPPALLFYYRTSPRRLSPLNAVGSITRNDPPLDITGMTITTLDPSGRLEWFHRIPPQRAVTQDPPPPTDWSVLFRLAGLDMSQFTPATPEWLSRGPADARAAWVGTAPGRPDIPLRLEAASFQGQPIFFRRVWPWSRPIRMEEAPISLTRRIVSAIDVAFFVGLIAAALVVCRRNVRAHRGDPQGATRLVLVAVGAQLVTWLLNDPSSSEPQQALGKFFLALGEALVAGGMLYMMYLALEPAVRRYWPDSLLGWTRLIHGNLRDARVGRDVLAGFAGGSLIVVLFGLQWPLQRLFGYEGLAAALGNLRFYEGPRYVLGIFSSFVGFQAMFNAMWCVFAIVGLKRLLKNMWLVSAVASIVFTLVAAGDLYTDQPGSFWVHFAFAIGVVAVIVLMATRFGLLAVAVTFLVTLWSSAVPWTLDSNRWDFPVSALSFTLLALVAIYGGYAAQHGDA
jgi:serine/threonine-protein kinase